MSEKGIVIRFLVSAVLALSSFSQVSSKPDDQFRELFRYEEMYQDFLKSRPMYAAVSKYMISNEKVIDERKLSLDPKIQPIYKEVVEESLLPLIYLSDKVMLQYENHQEQVALLFYIKFLVFCNIGLANDIKLFILKHQEKFSQETKDKTLDYLKYLNRILLEFQQFPTYELYIPIVKDLYLKNQRKNKEDEKKAEILMEDVETVSKFIFAKEPNLELPQEDYIEKLEKCLKLFDDLFPGIFIGIEFQFFEVDYFFTQEEGLSIILGSEPSLRFDRIKDLTDRIDESRLLVNIVNKKSRIVKIFQILMGTLGLDVLKQRSYANASSSS